MEDAPVLFESGPADTDNVDPVRDRHYLLPNEDGAEAGRVKPQQTFGAKSWPCSFYRDSHN